MQNLSLSPLGNLNYSFSKYCKLGLFLFILGHKNWHRSGSQEKGHWSQTWIQLLIIPTVLSSAFQVTFKLIKSEHSKPVPPGVGYTSHFLVVLCRKNDTGHRKYLAHLLLNQDQQLKQISITVNCNDSTIISSLTPLFISRIHLETSSIWLEKRVVSTYSRSNSNVIFQLNCVYAN